MLCLKRCLLIFVLLVTTKGDNCSRHCRPAPSGEVVCLASGECSEGCKPGFFGKTCKKLCNENCVGSICSFNDGTCSGGCKDNYCGNQCTWRCISVSKSTRTTTKYYVKTTNTPQVEMTSTVSHMSTYGTRKTERYNLDEGTSLPVFQVTLQNSNFSTDTSEESTPASATKGGTPAYINILVYSGIGVVVLLVAVVLCFLFMRVRRNHSRNKCQYPPEDPEVQVPSLMCNYLNATQEVGYVNQESVDVTHEYEVVE